MKEKEAENELEWRFCLSWWITISALYLRSLLNTEWNQIINLSSQFYFLSLPLSLYHKYIDSNGYTIIIICIQCISILNIRIFKENERREKACWDNWMCIKIRKKYP